LADRARAEREQGRPRSVARVNRAPSERWSAVLANQARAEREQGRPRSVAPLSTTSRARSAFTLGATTRCAGRSRWYLRCCTRCTDGRRHSTNRKYNWRKPRRYGAGTGCSTAARSSCVSPPQAPRLPVTPARVPWHLCCDCAHTCALILSLHLRFCRHHHHATPFSTHPSFRRSRTRSRTRMHARPQ
jgi:hypothetical protein